MNEETKEVMEVMDEAHAVEPLTGFWRNKKRGNIYRVLQDGIVNTTNAQDGTTMVMYVAIRDDADAPFTFVRERVEFLAKFHPVWFNHATYGWEPL